VEVEGGDGRHRQGSLAMAAISFVYTIARVAEMLGEDDERLRDLALYMEPEDGRLRVCGTGEDATLAFTRNGVERLPELIAEKKR
jgi:hypothetical protein